MSSLASATCSFKLGSITPARHIQSADKRRGEGGNYNDDELMAHTLSRMTTGGNDAVDIEAGLGRK